MTRHLSSHNRSRHDRIRFIGMMLAVLLASFGIRLLLIDSFQFGRDQAGHILIAKLLAIGHEPYAELFVSYPPLFVWSLRFAWRLWGDVHLLKFVMIAYTQLGITSVGVVTRRLHGRVAGVTAATALSFSLPFLAGSCMVATEVPGGQRRHAVRWAGVHVLVLRQSSPSYWRLELSWQPACSSKFSVPRTSVSLRSLSSSGNWRAADDEARPCALPVPTGSCGWQDCSSRSCHVRCSTVSTHSSRSSDSVGRSARPSSSCGATVFGYSPSSSVRTGR